LVSFEISKNKRLQRFVTAAVFFWIMVVSSVWAALYLFFVIFGSRSRTLREKAAKGKGANDDQRVFDM
jgi:hypothetical protein